MTKLIVKKKFTEILLHKIFINFDCLVFAEVQLCKVRGLQRERDFLMQTCLLDDFTELG